MSHYKGLIPGAFNPEPTTPAVELSSYCSNATQHCGFGQANVALMRWVKVGSIFILIRVALVLAE